MLLIGVEGKSFRIFAAAFRSGVGRVPGVGSSLAFGVGVESIVREILRVAAQVAQHGAQVQNGFAIALAQVICATSFLVLAYDIVRPGSELESVLGGLGGASFSLVNGGAAVAFCPSEAHLVHLVNGHDAVHHSAEGSVAQIQAIATVSINLHQVIMLEKPIEHPFEVGESPWRLRQHRSICRVGRIDEGRKGERNEADLHICFVCSSVWKIMRLMNYGLLRSRKE